MNRVKTYQKTFEVAECYRYTFNGKETDTETDLQDYGMRIYNPRLGKFLSVDPLSPDYPELTCYQFASNTPIQAIDFDGLESRLKYSGSCITNAASAPALKKARDEAAIKRSQQQAVDQEQRVKAAQAKMAKEKADHDKQAAALANAPGGDPTLAGSLSNPQVQDGTGGITRDNSSVNELDKVGLVSAVGDALGAVDALNSSVESPSNLIKTSTDFVGPLGDVIDVSVTAAQVVNDINTSGTIQPETYQDAAVTVFEIAVVDRVALVWPIGTVAAATYYVGKIVISAEDPKLTGEAPDPGAAPQDATQVVPMIGPPAPDAPPAVPAGPVWNWMPPN